MNTEALEIDRAGKRVRVRGPEGEAWLPYDKLILAQGGNPIMPPLPGADAPHVFKLWTVPDMDRLDAFIGERKPTSAVVVGGGFIGLEMAEAFRKRGLADHGGRAAPHGHGGHGPRVRRAGRPGARGQRRPGDHRRRG